MVVYILVRAIVLGIIGAIFFILYKLIDSYLNKKMKNL